MIASTYTLNISRFWLIRDKGEETDYNRSSLLFHVSSGDYLATLATILQFFEETIKSEKITPEMQQLQLKAIRSTMENLLYLNKNYKLVPKKETELKKP